MTLRQQLTLHKLYASVPRIDCKGLCFNSCGPIDMSRLEYERIVARGVEIPPFTPGAARSWARDEKTHQCPALSAEGRCTVYDIRPLICRLWGVVESMQCPHGCEAEAILTDEQCMRMLAESLGLDPEEVVSTLFEGAAGEATSRFMRNEITVEELDAAIKAHLR